MKVVTYPRPDIKFKHDFIKHVLDNDVKMHNNVVTNDNSSVILLLYDVHVNIYDDKIEIRRIPVADAEEIVYVFSGEVDLSPIDDVHDHIQVGNYYFFATHFVAVIRLLHKYNVRKFDFYLIRRYGGYAYLGIGCDLGFILILGFDQPVGAFIPLYVIMSEKYFITVEKETKNDIDIQVPDHIIEKWIRELGLDF